MVVYSNVNLKLVIIMFSHDLHVNYDVNYAVVKVLIIARGLARLP